MFRTCTQLIWIEWWRVSNRIQTLKFWCLLFCIRINLNDVTKAFHGSGTIDDGCGCLSVGIEYHHILCDIFSDEDEESGWSKDKIQKLAENSTHSCTCGTLSQPCHWISTWCFPIKREPSSMQVKIKQFLLTQLNETRTKQVKWIFAHIKDVISDNGGHNRQEQQCGCHAHFRAQTLIEQLNLTD